MSTTKEISDNSSLIDAIEKSFLYIKEGIKSSNSLPNMENFNYYSCFPTFNKLRNLKIQKIVDLMQSIILKAEVAGNINERDLEEKFDLLLESNDIFLDRVGICIDEEFGINRNPSIELIISQANISKNINGCWNTSSKIDKLSTNFSSTQAIRLLAGKNIQRPQLTFKDVIDNSQKPWQPKIKLKPNSIKPLSLYTIYNENGQEVYSHPYEYELENFDPPLNQLVKRVVHKYKSIDKTPLILIEKIEDLKKMLKDLEKIDEIGIDLEHHSYRSFQGITCLMQISTRNTDYIIDTLKLRTELYILNEIFTKPSILKVFHGADSDILWLQRDLSLYIVNMFDTHQAAKQLDLPFLGLSYLLKTYCQIDVNKHFQLADWRIRPLPNELKMYARNDTHYLLYLKDILSNSLIDVANGKSNILRAVYCRSTDICKNVFSKPKWTEESYLNMYRRSQKLFNNQQLCALKELHKWRDETARIEDDSTNYVLPNHMLLNIAETLPREMQGVLACCNPIPPLVRQNLLKIHKMILKAREQPLIKPILAEDIKQQLTQRNRTLTSKSWIYNPHDVPSSLEARADLSCLLDAVPKKFKSKTHLKLKPIVSAFKDSSSEGENENVDLELKKKRKLLFFSPFERYKKVHPFIIEEEKKHREKETTINYKIGELNKSTRETVGINREYQNFIQDARRQTDHKLVHNSCPFDSVAHKRNTNDELKLPVKALKQRNTAKRKRYQ